MHIFTIFYIKEVTPEGDNLGVKPGYSIVWFLGTNSCLIPGDRYIIYPRGTYTDLDLESLMVTMVKEADPNIEFNTEKGGFEIPEMPLHITTNPGGLHNIEGGLRAQANGWLPWTGNLAPLGIAEIKTSVVLNPYVTPPQPAC